MKIILGSDHAGFGLKQMLAAHVSDRFEIHDVGAFSRESCDYPRIARELTRLVLAEKALGILIWVGHRHVHGRQPGEGHPRRPVC